MSAIPVLDYLDELLNDARPAPAAKPQPAPASLETRNDTAVSVPTTEPAAANPVPEAAKAAPASPTPATSVPPVPAHTTPAHVPAAMPKPAPAATALHPLLAPVQPPPPKSVDTSVRWLRLRCGSQTYALELLKVQEVVLPTPPLPLRGTSAAMQGVINLRGQVVPLLDLGRYLGSGAVTVDAAARIVVLEENGESLGLLVSAVEDVTSLNERLIESPENARPGHARGNLFRGIARQGQQQPLILLDASILLHAS